MPPAGDSPDLIPRKAIVIIILVILAIAVAGAFFYQYQERMIKDGVIDELSSITLLKSGQIAAWRSERQGDAEVLTQNRILAERVSEYLASPDPTGRSDLLTLFNQINASYHYRNVNLIDPDRRSLLSLDPADPGLPPRLNAVLAESFITHTAVLTDIIPGPGNQSPRMYAIAPLILTEHGQDRDVGAIILTIDPTEELYPLIQSWPVPSQTAETLLVEREGDHVLFLNELRHQKNTALNLTLPLTQMDLPAVMAVTGTTGPFEGTDYRGEDVISVLEPVPGSPWFMVGKIDTDEAYAAWRTRAVLITILVDGMLAGVFILLGLFWQRRQKYYYRNQYATESAHREEEERNRMRMEALIRISAMESATDQELFEYVLDAASRLTASPLAFTGLISADESVFDITAWSKSVMKDCTVAAAPIHFPIAKAGIWADSVRKRQPVLVNDYSLPLPEKKGLPAGHVPIRRFISVPIFEGGRIVMVSAVANKDADYTKEDIDHLTLLMQGVWAQFRKRKADETLQQKTTDLEAAFEEITATEEELRANYEELARTRDALKVSEQKYRNLYTYAQVGLFETSFRNATVVICNERYATLAGYSSVDEAIGSDILHLYANPEDRTEVGRILREQGHIENRVLKLRNHATGKIFWAQFSARFDYVREVAEGSIIDITAQITAEMALRESEEAFRSLAENANDGFLIGNAEGMHVFANQRAAEITGYSVDELVRTSIRQITRPDEYDRVIGERFRKRIAGEPAPNQYETILVGKDGKDIAIELSSAKIQWYGQPADLIVFRDITKRKEMMRTLIESERRLREAQEMARLGFWSWDVGTGAVEWSDEVYRIFGLDPQTFTPQIDSILALSPWPDDQQRDKELIQRAMESREPGTYEQRFLRPDKSIGYYHSTFQGRYDDAGNLVSVVGTVLDITDRVMAEKALRENESRFRGVFDRSTAGKSITAAPDGTLLRINQAFADMLGYTIEELQQVNWADITYPEDLPESRECMRSLLAGERTEYRMEKRYIHKSGRIVWGDLGTTLMRDSAGTPLYLITTIIDITGKKLAEETIREANDAFSQAQTLAHVGSWYYVTATGRVTWSDETYRIFGYEPGGFDLTLENIRKAIHPEDLETHDRVLADASATGYYKPEEYRLIRPDGTIRTISGDGKVFRDGSGTPIKIIGVIQDITERKEAERQREALIRDLEQKNAELERYTYTVSHDLKSPLITIKGFAGLLEDDARSSDPDQLKRDVGRISKAADTMQALLNDVLELSRIGRIVNPPSLVPFGMIAREAVELLEVPLAEHGISVEIAPDLPVVLVDHTRIREVMVNLIENAIKFFGNQPAPRIRIGAETGETMTVFFVQDNGIGIDPRYLDRIFNLFEKLDPAVPGTGIGLTIVRRIIEVHGGRIWAESEGPGKGTTIRFTLPAPTDTNNNR